MDVELGAVSVVYTMNETTEAQVRSILRYYNGVRRVFTVKFRINNVSSTGFRVGQFPVLIRTQCEHLTKPGLGH